MAKAQMVENLPADSAGDLGSIPGLGTSLGKRNGCPLQYSGLENSMDRGAWRATVHRVARSRIRLTAAGEPVPEQRAPGKCSAISLTSGAGKTGQPLVKE